jgi:hypothetical protein
MAYTDAGASHFPDIRPAGDYYMVWVEPLVGSRDHPQGLFLDNSDPNLQHPELGLDYPVARSYGWRFYSDTETQAIGVRFWKPPSDSGSTHPVDLWADTGGALAHAVTANETASGWQMAWFDSPVAIHARQFYRVSFHSSMFRYQTGYLRNHEIFNLRSPLHVEGVYKPSNGRHDQLDNWPTNYRGSVGVLPNSGAEWTNGAVTNH